MVCSGLRFPCHRLPPSCRISGAGQGEEAKRNMNDGYKIFWGDTHHNTYQGHIQDPPMDEVIAFASTYMDFYTGAYYTPIYIDAIAIPHHTG